MYDLCSHLPKTWVQNRINMLLAANLISPKSNFPSICSILPHLVFSPFFCLCLSLAWWPVVASTHWAPLINTCPINPSMAQGWCEMAYKPVPLMAATMELLEALIPPSHTLTPHKPGDPHKEASDGFLPSCQLTLSFTPPTSGLSSYVGGRGDVLINDSKHYSSLLFLGSLSLLCRSSHHPEDVCLFGAEGANTQLCDFSCCIILFCIY